MELLLLFSLLDDNLKNFGLIFDWRDKMSIWSLEFGDVKHWDENKFIHDSYQMKMEYNSENDFPVKITQSNSQHIREQESQKLSVKKIDSQFGNVEICGEVYYFDDYQLAQIESVQTYWYEEKSANSSYTTGSTIHLGLVPHYSTDSHNFVISDLEIHCGDVVTLRIKEYDPRTNMFQSLSSDMCILFTCEFVKIQGDYKLYKICDNLFLLNESQADLINMLIQ
jgi:hypothetical protein